MSKLLSLSIAPLALVFVLGPPAQVSSSSERAVEKPRGHLVIVGGGGTSDAMLARALELAGGTKKAKVAVFAQASSVATSGEKNVKMWLEAGAGEARAVDLADTAGARETLARADLIWFSGGDQSRLMKDLAPTDLPDLIRERYAAGAVVGGTSAGAAVMSRVMITGDYAGGMESEEALGQLRGGTVLTAEGLGLFAGTIVDQHFVKRRRFNRLLACVLEHPDLVGIGIDERTAIVVSGTSFEVIGENNVLVLDARASATAASTGTAASTTAAASAPVAAGTGKPLAGSGVVLTLLTAGMKHDLATLRPR